MLGSLAKYVANFAAKLLFEAGQAKPAGVKILKNMAKSQATFMKKQLEKNRMKKKEDKEQRKLERQQNSTSGDLENMMAYVNEFGEITSTPPEKK